MVLLVRAGSCYAGAPSLFSIFAELDELLPPTKRGPCFVHNFDAAASVKDAIEALGVPHTEIGFILIDVSPWTFPAP